MNGVVKRETEFFQGGWIDRYYDFAKVSMVQSYDYSYDQDHYKEVPEFVESLWEVTPCVIDLMIDYFIYREYKKVEEEMEILCISFDRNHSWKKEFQEKILQEIIDRYPQSLIAIRFAESELTCFGMDEAEAEAEKEELFHFYESLQFTDPRIRGEAEDAFMMVYEGNAAGFEYLDTLNVSKGFCHPDMDPEEFEKRAWQEEVEEGMWALEDLEQEGAFTDEGIFPGEYSYAGSVWDFEDEYAEFKKRRAGRYVKELYIASADEEEIPFF